MVRVLLSAAAKDESNRYQRVLKAVFRDVLHRLYNIFIAPAREMILSQGAFPRRVARLLSQLVAAIPVHNGVANGVKNNRSRVVGMRP